MGHDLVWCEKCREWVYFDGHPESHWDSTKSVPKKQPKKRTKR